MLTYSLEKLPSARFVVRYFTIPSQVVSFSRVDLVCVSDCSSR